jgi:hypothetical protein
MANSTKSLTWYQGNKQDLTTLRKSLDLFDPNEINSVLVQYTRTIELLIAEFPDMNVDVKRDWAIANALSPDWFGDGLSTRIQNTMLVSALLLTVTASAFVGPFASDSISTGAYRVTFYVNGICSALFLVSIFLGICFIENAMSRAYCWSDRFTLIVQQYHIKDISQISAVVGTILFPITLLCPMSAAYLKEDTYFMYIFYAVYSAACLYFQITSMGQAAGKQNIRTKRLAQLTDPLTGRLLDQFLPPVYGELADLEVDKKDDDNGGSDAAEDSPAESFKVMYETDHEIVHKPSLCDCIKTSY